MFCMVFDHALFTLGYMFGHSFSALVFDLLAYISPAFAATFVMMCGASCMLSRNNLKRGIRILSAALGVTIFSLFFMSDAPIIFGVLHLLGSCVILYALVHKAIDKIPVGLGLTACAVLFFLTYSIDTGYLGVAPFCIKLPDSIYDSGFLMMLGFRSPMSSYSDYFPLLPWMFAFFAGVFIGRYFTAEGLPQWVYKSRVPFFSLLGTNAFFVYIIHQPLIFGVYYLISLIGGI